MGAIAGVVYRDAFQVTDLLKPMLDTLSRRCKGAQYPHTWRNVQVGALGQSLGTNTKHTVFVALDGTILNLKSLIQDIRHSGHNVDTQDPATLVAHAYELWGAAFLQRINGDFAVAILDEVSSQLLIARDRTGKCPLFWYQDDHHFIFSSEMNAILATGAVPQTPAVDGIATYLSLGYFPQDLTPIQKVNKLIPGHYLTLLLNQHKSIHPYWSYSSFFTQPVTEPPARVAEHLNHMLENSVEQHIASKASVGCLVSGGLGSASVAYYSSKLDDGPKVSAFTVGFQRDNAQDIRCATEVAQELTIPHKLEVITQRTFLDDLVKVIWHLGEPLADPNVLVTWRLAKLAAGETTMVLSGMGSDELLAGHSRYTVAERTDRYIPLMHRLIQPFLHRFLVPWTNRIYRPWALHLLKDARTNPWQAEYIRAHTLFSNKMLGKASPNLQGIFDPDTFLHKFHRLSRIPSIVSSFRYFDMKTTLPECYMLQYDRLTSAHGLDWRAPYLSREIVEYLAGVPEPEQLAVEDTASCLKTILRPYLSDAVVNRPKQSRPHFLESWANTPEVQQAFDLLQTGTCVDTGYISSSWLSEQLATHDSRRKAFHHLWAVLALEIWLRLFITRPIQRSAPDVGVIDLLSD